MLTGMASPVRSRSGRPEFGRVYLRSLIASTEERVELHRSKGHRLRRRLATRRLRKLLAYENQRHLRVGTVESAPPRIAVAAVAVLLLAAVLVLGVLQFRQAAALWVTIAELALIVLTLLWFFLAVARVPSEHAPPKG